MHAKFIFRLSVGILFLCCFASNPVLGQLLYVYTDSWADPQSLPEFGQENGEVIIVGSGVIEIESGHSVDLEVRMTGPLGTTIWESGTWNQGNFIMTLTTSLDSAWGQGGNPGNYLTEATVQMTCPWEPATTSAISLPISIKREGYIFTGGVNTGGRFGYGFCEYDNNCPFGQGICGLPYFTVDKYNANASCPGYIQCRTLYVRGVCLNIAKVCTAQTTSNPVCDYN